MSADLVPTVRKGSKTEGTLFIEPPKKEPRRVEQLGTKQVPSLPVFLGPPPEPTPLESKASSLLKLFMDLQHHKRMVVHLQAQAAEETKNPRNKELWSAFEKFSKAEGTLEETVQVRPPQKTSGASGEALQETKSAKKRKRARAKSAAETAETAKDA
jgi:hypothetical protein